jgi:hypothetical protein
VKVFLDANVLLDFYKVSRSTLTSIKALLILQGHEKVTVLTTSQVQDEVRRNREVTIKTALAEFEKDSVGNNIPAMVRELPAAKEAVALAQQYRKARDAVSRVVREQARSKTLPADQLIAEMFSTSTQVELDDQLYSKALMRHNLRNPPGKRESMGDALNWESCLRHCAGGDTLHLVSQDGDYFDPLNADEPYPFLREEFAALKKGKLLAYRTLLDFFQANFPGALDVENLNRELWAEKLLGSRSFNDTHRAVSELLKEKLSLSKGQIRLIADAFIINDQVRRISLDEDVRELMNFVRDHRSLDLEELQAQAFASATIDAGHEAGFH